MPTAKSTPARDSTGIPVPVDVAADALYRSAAEAVRQHERVSKLNDRSAHHTEMAEASELREVAHVHLKARTALYESAAAIGKGTHGDPFWHAANAMWLAAREYVRRHRDCDASSAKLSKHSTEKLGELTMEYELAASALLGLKNAMGDYKKLRPDA